MNITSLDHLVLTVKDLKASIGFYSALLGMKHIQFGENRHALQFHKQKINLHQAENIFQPCADSPISGSADLCFIVDTEMTQMINELNLAGVDIIEGPVQRTGQRVKLCQSTLETQT